MPDPPNEGTDQPRPLGADGKPVPGPQQVQQTLAQKRMAQQQAQVDQVVDIMRSNVEKVIERDVKLHKLDERAEQLESGASQFETAETTLKHLKNPTGNPANINNSSKMANNGTAALPT